MKNFILLVIFTLVIGCGFKVVNKSQLMNFNLKEINTSGENRINYKLKNKLLIFNQTENNNKSYNINLKTDKIKKIKEKNINNVITKYEIEISTQVIVKTLQFFWDRSPDAFSTAPDPQNTPNIRKIQNSITLCSF